MMIERTKYVTTFEREDGKRLWRSGRVIGNVVIPEGQRPAPDREVVYENIGVTEVDREKDGYTAVTEVSNEQRDDGD